MTDNEFSDEMSSWPIGGVDAELERHQARYVPSLRETKIEGLLRDAAFAETVIESSFGVESAALLHFVTGIRDAPRGLQAKRHCEQARLGCHSSTISAGLREPYAALKYGGGQ